MKETLTPLPTFSSSTFQHICDHLANLDPDLNFVILTYGYPPLWTRPNTFETLVHIILEQQVSLASAKAALTQLQGKLQNVTPENVLLLTDEELKSCYFSQQKTKYVRHLATALVNKQLELDVLEKWSDEAIRAHLLPLKGIGNWTIDVYLMFVLQKPDIFPIGDLAAINALKQLKKLPKETPKEAVMEITLPWQPYRTIATMILWHYYLSTRKKA